MRPSVWQIVLIVVVLLILFGWRRLPDMARSVGQSLRIFKSEVEQMTDKDNDSPSAASSDTVRSSSTQSGRVIDDPASRTAPSEHPGSNASEHADPAPRHDGPGPRG